ncbi:Cysteine protease atg4 [Sarracenia purpurea var. burkii]
MKGFHGRTSNSKHCCKTYSESPTRVLGPVCSEPVSSDSTPSKTSAWSGFFLSAFSIFETHGEPKVCGKKGFSARSNAWTEAVKRVMNGGSMRRFQERVLGLNKTGISSSTSDIWLLGVCYKISQEDSSSDPATSDGVAAFVEDFSSRILLTYRKGFDAIGDSKYTSDVNWGCMLRSSQMLVAQALIVHRLGRCWRKVFHKPLDKEYIEILHLFGDSEASAFSIHNLLQAGTGYDLAAGAWVGPYAMCRTWESLARCKRHSFPMAIYVVSGDEDGERGGAPVVCIEDASRHCFEFSNRQVDWTPILLLVPLVLGLDKVNPRYIPLLGATFTFPQSLGILGGRPGASTYIVGVQDEEAFYLDPHEVQPVADIGKDNLEADTSSYHCNVLRHVSLDSIDPSLAIGFYCRDKDDFNDFCDRASKLADQSKGAPLFTVTRTRNIPKAAAHYDILSDGDQIQEDGSFDVVTGNNADFCTQEDDWQLL